MLKITDFTWKLLRICTTSPKCLAGKPVTLWTCTPKPVPRPEWLRINHRAAGKAELLQPGSHVQPSALFMQSTTFGPFCVVSKVAYCPNHLPRARQRVLSATQKRTGENGTCHHVFQWLHVKYTPFKSQPAPSPSQALLLSSFLYPITFLTALCS